MLAAPVIENRQKDRTSVQVARTTFDALDRVVEATGHSKAEFLARLVEWFESQPPQVQSAITDSRGDAAGEIAKLKLAEMAAAGELKPSEIQMNVADACELIRKLADKIEGGYATMEAMAIAKDPPSKKKG